jgi:hypothetical protein
VAVREDGRRIIRLAAGGTTRDLGPTDGHAQLVGDILLHVRGGALLAQRVEAGDGPAAAAGRATVLATNVGAVNGRGSFAASPRLLLVSTDGTRARELVWIEEDGTRGPAASDHTDAWQVRMAPDDHAAAITALEPQLRTLDVYIVPLRVVPPRAGSDTVTTTSLTLALAADTDPVWSPDGRRVLFRSLQDGTPRLYSRIPNQPGAPIEPARPLRRDLGGGLGGDLGRSTAGGGEVPVDWRATTARTPGEVLYQATSARGDTDLLALDLVTGMSRTVVGSGFNESDGRWSPGGIWLAYVSDEFGQPDVFVQRRSGGARARVTLAGGIKPRWDGDGRRLYFLRDAEIMRVTVQAGSTQPGAVTVSALQHVADAPGVRDFDAAHLSHRLLAVLPVANSRVVEARAVVDWPALAGPAQ